jgi:hypothetical protein
MSLVEAIDRRVSRRTYKPVALSDADAEMMLGFIAEYTNEARMELVVGNGAAFAGLTKSYGLFKGVTNYIALIGDSTDEHTEEKLGYYGALVMLRATILGLGTCFVGGTFDRKLISVASRDSEYITSVITIGYVLGTPTGKEKFIRGMIHRKSKSADELSSIDSAPPGWFKDGVKAVMKAPSAINRQPVTFSWKDGVASASVEDSSAAAKLLDLGVAKLYFELGAGGGKWQWGNRASFENNEELK